MTEDIKKSIETFLQTILPSMGFPQATQEIQVEDSAEKVEITILIKGDDLELLIGFHGKNLYSLHLVLLTYLRKLIPEPTKRIMLHVDVGDYYAKQDEKTKQLVIQAIEEVKLLEEPYEFQPMPPRARRIVHMEVANHPEVRSESMGEGMDRRVVIYPKNAQTAATETVTPAVTEE